MKEKGIKKNRNANIVGVRLPPLLTLKLKGEAQERGTTVSAVIREKLEKGDGSEK